MNLLKLLFFPYSILFRLLFALIVKPAEKVIGIGVDDALIQTFYFSQPLYVDAIKKRKTVIGINDLLDNKSSPFWHQNILFLSFYDAISPATYRLMGILVALSFPFYFYYTSTLPPSSVCISVAVVALLSPRFIATILFRQNYNLIPLQLFAFAQIILINQQTLGFHPLLPSILVCIYGLTSITTVFLSACLLPLVFINWSACSALYLFSLSLVAIYWISKAITCPKTFYKVLRIIGFLVSDKTNSNTWKRPLSLPRALAINASSIISFLIVLPSLPLLAHGISVMIAMVILLALFIVNESFFSRFADTHTTELLSHFFFFVLPLFSVSLFPVQIFLLCTCFLLNLAPYIITIQDHIVPLRLCSLSMAHFPSYLNAVRLRKHIHLYTKKSLENLLLSFLSSVSNGVYSVCDLKSGLGRFFFFWPLPQSYNEVFAGYTNLLSGITYAALKYQFIAFPGIYEFYYSDYGNKFTISFDNFLSIDVLKSFLITLFDEVLPSDNICSNNVSLFVLKDSDYYYLPRSVQQTLKQCSICGESSLGVKPLTIFSFVM